MEGRNIASESRVFTLPTEILTQISGYLSTDDLRNLALVNSDSRQLARSRQFRSVLLGYSVDSSLLVEKLCSESKERAQNLAPGAYLGSSIRRLTVSAYPSLAEERHRLNWSGHPEVTNERQRMAPEAFEVYLRCIETALSSRSMPHLELLNWRGMIAPKSLFTAMACSTIQRLSLVCIKIDEEFELPLSGNPRYCVWPLRSLHLEVYRGSLPGQDEISLIPFTISILRLCAPSLETLNWLGEISPLPELYSFASFGYVMQFPCLRRLGLGGLDFSDSSILESMLGSDTKVRELEMDIESCAIVRKFFAKRGNIRTLEALYCESMVSLEFVRANSQLRKILILLPMPPSVIDMQLLPLLVESFHNLASLSLVWEGISISESALEQIGTLRSLRQLKLSAGAQSGWRPNWFVDHDAASSRLSRLKNLRNLTFNLDTYKKRSGASFNKSDEDYYSGRFFEPWDDGEREIWQARMAELDPRSVDTEATSGEGDPIFDERRIRTFETVHSMRMQAQATKYVDALPSLRSIYVGKTLFSVEDSARGRQAVVVSRESGEYGYLRQHMFDL